MRYHKKYDRDLLTPFPHRNESKLEVCARRNKRLMEFFDDVQVDIKIIGNPERPCIVVNNSYCLSAYVHNFNLIFLDRPSNGIEVASYKLVDQCRISHNDFIELFEDYEHQRVFKIKYSNTDLYLSGYNFKNKRDFEDKIPVFARKRYKLYFKEERIHEIMDEFPDYPLEIE